MTMQNSKGMDPPRMIQEVPWLQAKLAIRESLRFDDFSAFRAFLQENLPYNSPSTRRQHAQTIALYFFPGQSLDVLPRRAWEAYRDDDLLEELMRHQYLAQEPTVAHFVASYLSTMAPGVILERSVLETYIEEVDPKNRPKMVRRLGETLRRLGFVVRQRQRDIVAQLKPGKTPFLLLVHRLFAPSPRIVTLRDILAHRFWLYLGLREEGEVRRILHEASAQSLIAGYARVDQLEQITTSYTLDQWLEKRLRL